MKPSEVYQKIESVLAGEPSLSDIRRFQNTYQETLLDSNVSTALKEDGVAVCFYFLRLLTPTSKRPGVLIADSVFTIAILENVSQHNKWRASNPNHPTYKGKSALEIAERIAETLINSCSFRSCGLSDLKFGESTLERVQAENGIAQIDLNLAIPTQLVFAS